jgi:hypothetical protein
LLEIEKILKFKRKLTEQERPFKRQPLPKSNSKESLKAKPGWNPSLNTKPIDNTKIPQRK